MTCLLSVRFSDTAPFPIWVSSGPTQTCVCSKTRQCLTILLIFNILYVFLCWLTFETQLISLHGRDHFLRNSNSTIRGLHWLNINRLPANWHLIELNRSTLKKTHERLIVHLLEQHRIFLSQLLISQVLCHLLWSMSHTVNHENYFIIIFLKSSKLIISSIPWYC